MGEMAEAPAPVDQSPPSDVSSGAGESQAAASDCYNARVTPGSEGQAASQAEPAPASETPDPEDGQESSGGASTEGTNLDGDHSSEAYQEKSNSGTLADRGSGEQQEPRPSEAGKGDQPSTVRSPEPARADDQGEESEPPKTEPAPSPEIEPKTQEASQEGANGGQEEKQAQERNKNEETPSNGDGPEPHKLKYDPQKEKELARRQMMNPHYFLPTDFSKYFDVRTGEGPKQQEESLSARANRRMDEMKAWRKKIDEQSPMIYNRKVSKPGA